MANPLPNGLVELAAMEEIYRSVLFQATSLETVPRTLTFAVEPSVRGVVDGVLVDQFAVHCCPVPPFDPAFVRVVLDHHVTGGTRVTWELSADYTHPPPYQVQLQASPSGVPDTDDWVDVGAPGTDPAYLIDDRQRTWGIEEVLHYRVVLVAADGATNVSMPVRPAPSLDKQDWLLMVEIARKERLRMIQGVGSMGYLLKARRYGVRCHCVNPTTRERTDSHCLTCYGVGFVFGYHPPVPCFLAELEPHESRQMTSYAEGRGTTQDVVFWARLIPGLPVVQEDVWVGIGDDARYQIHGVKVVAKYRGVPIVHAAQFRRMPRTDIVYHVPLTPLTGLGCNWGVAGDGDGDGSCTGGDGIGTCPAGEPQVVCMPVPGAC